MKNKFKKILFLIFGLSFLLSTFSAEAENSDAPKAGALSATVWRKTDIILKSAVKYANPYMDVDVSAVFIHEDGTEIRLDGFWNGGDEWRVRFAPTKAGLWTYSVSCSDKSNRGIDGVTGIIIAAKNDGPTAVDRHGFVKISGNGRYFTYDDGTPFYWLGDTNWQAPNYVSVTRCNYPGCGCGNQFKHEVDDRAGKGFTVYQTYFDSSETDGGGQRATTEEPGLWLEKYVKIDPAAFSGKIDLMFDYLAEKGMVIALGYGVHANTVNAMNGEELERLSRYLTARYAAYPVVWITAQEITGEEQFDRWVDSARTVAAGDGYNHPGSAHQYPLPAENEFVERLGNEPWHDFYALQGGHGAEIPKKAVYESYWNNTRAGRAKPFVETEANYEDIICGTFNGYDASRISAWKANLCGSCGFTYGATGVWANNYSTAGNTGWLGTFSYEPWYMGIDKPGSFEMKYMADFFGYVGFSRLVPRFNDAAFSDLADEDKVVASSDNADTYVAYFYNRSTGTGVLRGLDRAAWYVAKWYDPLTGRFVEILPENAQGIVPDNSQGASPKSASDTSREASPGNSCRFTAPDGIYVIPPKPTCGDWVLLVTSREDLGEYVTEDAYRDSFASDPAHNAGFVNILDGATASASSCSTDASGAPMSIDGNPDTWWCAENGNFPQTLLYELPEPRTFDVFEMKMYHGTVSAGYVLEASDDGKIWKELYRCEDELAVSYIEDSLFACGMYEPQTAKYIRLTFNKVGGNWAAVIEAKAYLSARRTGVPEYGSRSAVPEVKCTGSFIYDADGNGADTTDALFDGDAETLWRPYAPIATQTILMDLGKAEPLRGINVVTGPGAAVPGYRIEGSLDGKLWTVLVNAAVREKSVVYDGGRRVVTEALSGEYRYVKLLWLNLDSNNAVKTIAEIRLYAGGEPLDEKPDNTPDGGEENGRSGRSMFKRIILPATAVLALSGAGIAGIAAAVSVRRRKNGRR